MTLKPLIPMVLAAVALGGCANAVHLQSEVASSTYDYSNFTTYHAGRDTRVEVHGNPFNMDAAAFARAVTAHMQGANFGRPTNFTTSPGPSADKNLHVVMAFNTTASSADLCTARNIGSRPARNTLSLKAAWCLGNRVDSWVDATVSGANSVNDPAFRDLVDETVAHLFPPHMDAETIRDDDGDDRPM